jgi:hypothetical protein
MALGFSTGELRRHLEVLQLSSRPNQYPPRSLVSSFPPKPVAVRGAVASHHELHSDHNHRLWDHQCPWVRQEASFSADLSHSTLHTTLLPIGLAIARSLKLHRLGVEPVCQLHLPGTHCVTHGTSEPHVLSDWDFVLRESGRRVWTVLQYHDRLSWQARETRGSSSEGDAGPLNIDDVGLGEVAIVRPQTEATMMSHLLGGCRAEGQH